MIPFAYPRIVTTRLYGRGKFIRAEPIANLTVQDYWVWAHSALSSNVERRIVAEFLVAASQGVAHNNNLRDPWADSDVIVPDGITPEGMIHIEVKVLLMFKTGIKRITQRSSFQDCVEVPLQLMEVEF